MAGDNLIYTIRVNNNGPSDAAEVVLIDQIPAGTTYQSISFPNSWKCRGPAVGTRGNIRCSKAVFATGDEAVFALRVKVATTAAGSTIFNTSSVTSITNDPNTVNNGSTNTTTVLNNAGGAKAFSEENVIGTPLGFFAWFFNGENSSR